MDQALFESAASDGAVTESSVALEALILEFDVTLQEARLLRELMTSPLASMGRLKAALHVEDPKRNHVAVVINHIRKKVRSRYTITTHWGVGYSLMENAQVTAPTKDEMETVA